MTLGGDGNAGIKHSKRMWTQDNLLKEALKFYTRLDWFNNSKSSYLAAKRESKDFFEQCCSHMKAPQKEWTKETTLEEARKHKNVHNWKKASNGSLKFAIKLGTVFYEQCKSHMKLRAKHEKQKTQKDF